MHTLLAVTFPEMGRGLLAVVVFGAALLAGLALLTMLYSAVQLWQARRDVISRQRERTAATSRKVRMAVFRAKPRAARRDERRRSSLDDGAIAHGARQLLEETG